MKELHAAKLENGLCTPDSSTDGSDGQNLLHLFPPKLQYSEADVSVLSVD